MNYFIHKKIVLGGIAILLVIISLLFRQKISDLLSFGEESPKVGGEIIIPAGDEKISENIPKTDIAPEAEGVRSYVGRDPVEVRPVFEDVKLFTEDQKKQIYAKIEENGRAVTINPEHFFGWMDLGMLKKTIGDFEGARDAWEYAGVIQPGNSISFSNLGELYWRYLPNFQKSETSFKTSIKHKPNDWQNYISLAELYHYSYKEKYDLAPQALLDGLKAIPDDETITRRLAYLYEQRNEWQKSLEWWEKILIYSPGDTEVQQRIDRVKTKISP